MKHTLKTIFTLSAISACFSVFSQDVKVTTNIPAEAEAGKEFVVELTVEKGDVSGFAKLQQELPAGLTASSDNPNGSTFSFKEQKVKFLWMALPGDKSFKVSYKVKVDASVIGNQILDGSFSYILNNETQKAALPKDIINITAPGTGAAVAQNKNVGTKTKVVETQAMTTSTPVETKTEPAVNSEATNSATINASSAEAEAAKAAENAAKQEASDRKKAEAEAERVAALARNEEAKAAKAAEKAAAKAASKQAVGGLVYKVQIAATNRKAEASEFKTLYNLTDEVSWESHENLNKYIVGNFESYKAAKSFSNSIRDNNAVPGPFVTAYKDGNRITVQEALGMQGR